MLAQLEYQAGQAVVWRDAVTNWFLRASGIPDAKGRVGNYPGRFEAESMQPGWLCGKDVDAVGSGVGRQGHRMRSAPVQRGDALQRRRLDGTRFACSISTRTTACRASG